MTENDILKCRLSNQLISSGKFNSAGEVLNWMGPIQAQEYGQAKYAVGYRTVDAKNIDIEKAIDEKKIVRTWALRGTLHILAASDIYHILSLVAPVIIPRYQPQFKKLNLDNAEFVKIQHCIIQLLQDGRQLTRRELFEGLEKNKISTAGLRGSYILYKAGWLGIICLGTRRSKQDTYTLLEEWVPKAKPIAIHEAAGLIAKQYFQSHGPATLKDFISWSGLAIKDANTGFELIKETLTKIEMNDQVYWMPGNVQYNDRSDNNNFLLPGFDEYLLGYKDRTLILDTIHTKDVILKNGIFKPVIVADGKIIGTWNRIWYKNNTTIETKFFDPLFNSTGDFNAEIRKIIAFM